MLCHGGRTASSGGRIQRLEIPKVLLAVARERKASARDSNEGDDIEPAPGQQEKPGQGTRAEDDAAQPEESGGEEAPIGASPAQNQAVGGAPTEESDPGKDRRGQELPRFWDTRMTEGSGCPGSGESEQTQPRQGEHESCNELDGVRPRCAGVRRRLVTGSGRGFHLSRIGRSVGSPERRCCLMGPDSAARVGAGRARGLSPRVVLGRYRGVPPRHSTHPNWNGNGPITRRWK